MQIQSNKQGFSAVRNRSTSSLKKTNKALSKVLEQLSIAQRINRASDDAAGLSISEQLSAQSRGFRMASNNISDAMSALNIADGVSHEIGDMLQRQRELSLQARSDTLTNEQREMIDVEYQNLSQEIDRIAEGTQFNTQDIANGEGLGDGSSEIQAGANQGETITLPIIDMTTGNLGTAGTSVTDSASASAALSATDDAINALSEQRSTIGAMVNQFQSAQNNLMVAQVNTTAAESILRDQDMAMGLTELTRARLLQETSIQAFARFNEISANHILGLLQ